MHVYTEQRLYNSQQLERPKLTVTGLLLLYAEF